MKQFYLIILFLSSLQIYSQDNSIMISGVVKNDSTAIEGVHILNLNSKIGTISNQFGIYKIPVILHDTIQLSSIQFQTKKVIIQQKHLDKKMLNIKLSVKVNELSEVIMNHEENTKGVTAMRLNLPNANKVPLNQLDRKLNYYSQAPTALVILATLLGQRGGIDDIYNIISGNRKRDRRLKYLIEEDKKTEVNLEYIRRIRVHFQDDFFIETLEIPKEKINSFIDYCLTRNIIFLFDKGRTIEIMNIFLNESKNFILKNQVTHLTKD